MKKLLYISVNSKPEDLSASKTVARNFINKFLEKNKDFQVEEIDLYKEHIPRLEYQYFEKRNCIIILFRNSIFGCHNRLCQNILWQCRHLLFCIYSRRSVIPSNRNCYSQFYNQTYLIAFSYSKYYRHILRQSGPVVLSWG